MGIVLPQTVKIRIGGGKGEYYESKGYGNGKRLKNGDVIEVNVLDLSKSSGTKVKIICDFCGKETYVHYGCISKDPYITTCRDKACTTAKTRYTSMLKYGCINPGSSKQAKDKREKTMIDRYGVPNAYCNGGCFREENKQKWIDHYGVDNPSKAPEVQDKIRETWNKNDSGPCSKQQKYLANLIGGEVNIPVNGYWADIVKGKVIVEYDGGAHDARCRIYNGCTKEEFYEEEKRREIEINKKGYKIIRIISKKDKLPYDDVILNLINGFKNFDFKVIRIDIDEGTIDKDYNEKWNCKFGELRKIKDKDLDKFNTSRTIK